MKNRQKKIPLNRETLMALEADRLLTAVGNNPTLACTSCCECTSAGCCTQRC
jgi:hypothetical protein